MINISGILFTDRLEAVPAVLGAPVLVFKDTLNDDPAEQGTGDTHKEAADNIRRKMNEKIKPGYPNTRRKYERPDSETGPVLDYRPGCGKGKGRMPRREGEIIRSVHKKRDRCIYPGGSVASH